jgi:hypothetical protein
MYSHSEIKTIVDNCNNSEELLQACLIFKVLILFGDLKKSHFLNKVTHMRLRELTILGK